MKTFTTLACVLCAGLSLAACSTSDSYDAGSNYASGRTAGEVDKMGMKKNEERVFRKVQTTK